MSIENLFVHFENLSRPLQLINCSGLLDHFPLVLPGWNINVREPSDQAPCISVDLGSQGYYTISTDWQDRRSRSRDEVDTICTLIAKVFKARTFENFECLFLHGATVELDGKLIIFPNKFRAGKSVLSVCMAAAGFQVYSDDVLPVSLQTGKGMAPAIAPRLRAPYPDNLDESTRQFFATRVALKGNRYHYVDLRPDLLAPLGQSAPIGAFVFLDREEGAQLELSPISESDALRQVVWQNFAREVDTPKTLGRLGQIVSQSQRFRLRYDRADDAVKFLSSELREIIPAGESRSANFPEIQVIQSATTDIPPGHYMRRSGISEISSEDQTFLTDVSGSAIHHLNPVGSAVWNLLAEPASVDQITQTLQTAFPDAPANQIRADVRKLVKALSAKKLLLEG